MAASRESSSDRGAARALARDRLFLDLKRLAIGGLAGCVAKTAIAPLERVRILAQTGEASSMAGASRLIVANEGVQGFWRSNYINCIRTFPSKGVLFMTHDRIVHQMRQLAGLGPHDSLGPTMFFAAGSASGMLASLLSYPFDLARTRVAGRIGAESRYTSLSGTLALTIREEGLLALYRGITPTLLGAIPYEGIKFCVWDMSEQLSRRHFGPDEGVPLKLARGALAGVIAGGVLYPNDTVRRLLQMQGTRPGEVVYRGMMHCYWHTLSTHGVGRFYRGIVPYLIRMVPNTAIQFGSYEFLKSRFDLQQSS